MHQKAAAGAPNDCRALTLWTCGPLRPFGLTGSSSTIQYLPYLFCSARLGEKSCFLAVEFDNSLKQRPPPFRSFLLPPPPPLSCFLCSQKKVISTSVAASPMCSRDTQAQLRSARERTRKAHAGMSARPRRRGCISHASRR